MVNSYSYTPSIINALEKALSPERLSTYQAVTSTPAEALTLYVWNTAISAALYGPLQALEVAIRNGFHQALTPVYGTDWYDNPQAGLTPAAISRVGEAKYKLLTSGKPADPSRVVAELSFGFWERLLSRGPQGNRNYEVTLWRPALHRAFPHARFPRSVIHKPLPGLRDIRNRIAHHEPIFSRNLATDYQTIIDVIGWMCPETRAWVEYQSTVSGVLATRP